MNLDTIVIDPGEAAERYAEYRQALRIERNSEDVALAAGYRAAARGLPLISLQRTIAAAGWHGEGLPRIAVVRADAASCFARWDGSDLVFSDVDDRWVNRGALVNEHSVRVEVPGDALPPNPARWRIAGSTIVPLIPPKYRPRARRRRGCHLLWEVESWTRVPPEDPALLRHIRGDLWAVLAVWELTELERLVLAQR